MSNVDERVVKMEFDNKAFEKNAEDTMSLLDKLKESLKFDKVQDSFKKITKASNKVDMSNVSNNVETVKLSFSAMEIAGMTAIANLTNTMMNFAKRTVGGIWSQTIQGGIKRSFNIEKAKFTIQGLGKDWKKLEKDINYGVSGTAYGFDEAAVAASSMAASGVKAGKDMSSALLAISGMAAMTGSSYSDIGNIFTTVAGNGRLLSQQLNQFSARGLNAAATLTDYINAHEELKKKLIEKGLGSTVAKKVAEFKNATKLTEQNVRTLVSGSVIDFKTFSNAMHDAFGKQAKAANKTFNGVMSNIKATLSRIGESFIHPLIENNEMDNMLKMTGGYIRELINDQKTGMRNLKEGGAEAFDELRKNAKYAKKTNDEIIAEYKKNPKEFLKSMRQIEGDSQATTVKWKTIMYGYTHTTRQAFIDQMKSDSKFLFDELRRTARFSGKTNEQIRKEFAKNPKELGKYIRANVKAFDNASNNSLKALMKTGKDFDKYAGSLWDKYSKVQYNIVGVLQAVKRVFGVVESKIKGSKFLKGFQKTAVQVCKVLILLLNGIAAAFGDVETKTGKALEVIGLKGKSHLIPLEKIWNRLRKVLGLTKPAFEDLKNTVLGIGAIFDALFYVVKEVIKAFIPSKKEVGGFAESILGVTGAIGLALQGFRDWIKTSGVVVTIVKVLKTALSILTLPIKLVVGLFGLIGNAVSALIKSFKKFDAPIKVVNKLFGTLLDVFGQIGKIFTKTGNKIINAFLKPFSREAKKTEKPGNMFADVLSKIAEAIQFFTKKASEFAGWIGKVIDKFIDFEQITKIGQNVKNTIDNTIIPAFKNFGNYIKNKFPKIKLPDFGSMLSKSSKGVKNGIKLPDFKDMFSNAGNSIKEGVSKIKLPDFGKIFSNAFNGVGDAVLAGLDKIRNIDFSKIFEAVKNGFDDFVTFLGEAKDRIGEAFTKIGEGIRNNLPSFDEFSQKLFDGFSNAVDKMSDFLPEPNSFGVALGDWIGAVISFVAKSIPYFVNILAAAFRTLVSHLPQIVTDLADGIKKALNKGLFEPITVGTGEFKREIPPLFDVMADTLKSMGKKFKGATLDDILGWLNKFLTAGALNQLRKTLKGSEELSGDIGKFFKKLGGSTDEALNGDNKGFINKLSKLSEAIKNFAIALGIIAASLVVLGHISEKSLNQGKTALAEIAAGIVIFAAALALIQKYTGADLTGMLNGLSGLVDGLKGLFVVLMAMTMVKDMSGPIGVLTLVMIELGAFIFILSKINPNPTQTTMTLKGLEAFINSVTSVIKMLVVLAVIPFENMLKAIFELGLVFAELTIVMFALSKIPVQNSLKSMISLLPVLGVMAIAIGALWVIKTLELDPKQLLWIAEAFGAIGAVMGVLSLLPIAAAIQGVINMAIFVGGLVALLAALGALKQIPGLEWLINEGGDLLNSIGKALGKFVGGFAEGIMASAPAIADDLSAFAIHLLPFITTMKMMKGDVSGNIKNITGAIKSLVDANLKESLSAFLGGGDLSDLATRFGDFMKQFMRVMDSLPEGGKDFTKKLSQIGKIAKVTKTLADVEKGLEAQGGLAAGVFGEKNFTKFITGVKKLYEGFVDIGKTAGKIKNIEAIQQVKSIAKALADTLAALPDENKGKFWLDAAGDSKLATFAKDLITFGKSVTKYLASFDGADTSQMEEVTKSVTKSIKSLSKAVSNKKNTQGFSSAGKNAMGSIASGFTDNSGKVTKALNAALASAVKGIKTTGIEKKGKELAVAFEKGISKHDASKAGKSLASSAISGMSSSSLRSSASTSGGYVATGFVNGITTASKLAAAYSAGKKLGNKALKGIKDAIDQGSPSKKAMQSGSYTGEGFVIGLRKWLQRAVTTGSDVGAGAISAMRRRIMDSSNLMDSVSEPVIRPIMDLSNVKMGANQINSMFGNRYAMGLAGTISGAKPVNRQVSIVNNVTVDGAENPTEWVDAFTKELEVQVRMG